MSEWRKSSYSGYNGNCVEVAWRRSSHSASSNCAEVAVVPTSGGQDGFAVAVRDSKNPGPVLEFSPAAWAAFLATVKGAPAGVVAEGGGTSFSSSI